MRSLEQREERHAYQTGTATAWQLPALFFLCIATGFAVGVSLIMLWQRLLLIEAAGRLGYALWVSGAIGGAGVVGSLSRRLRLTSCCLVVAACAFASTVVLVPRWMAVQYEAHSKGQMGYSIQAEKGITEWVEEVNRSLKAGDPISRLDTFYSDSFRSAERRINFGWKYHDALDTVITRLATASRVHLDLESEPDIWSPGCFAGRHYKLTVGSPDSSSGPETALESGVTSD